MKQGQRLKQWRCLDNRILIKKALLATIEMNELAGSEVTVESLRMDIASAPKEPRSTPTTQHTSFFGG
ncbi:MAG: hypothetical protein Ct9H300mP14_15080 [Gammaproteobacteria bacterium]|nr:MAG: hypothetical protein Ct9H300mP14_15080 [Gammaproteobacteria bacterium]